MNGAARIVAIRSRRFGMTRVAMIAGTAHAKLESSGITDCPDNPTRAHRAIDEECRAREIARVLHQDDEQEQDQDLRQEDDDAADARDHAVDDEALEHAVRRRLARPRADAADTRVDEIHERRRPREHRLEHDRHRQHEQDGRRPRPIDPIDEPRRAASRRPEPGDSTRASVARTQRVAVPRLGRERRLGAEQRRRAPPRARLSLRRCTTCVPRASASISSRSASDAMQVDARRRAIARRARPPPRRSSGQ